MPTVPRELHSRAIQGQSNFPVEHQLKILAQYALVLGLVVLLVIVVVMLLGRTP